jgi:hypothetical protein
MPVLQLRDDEVAFEEPLVSDEFADAGRLTDAAVLVRYAQTPCEFVVARACW